MTDTTALPVTELDSLEAVQQEIDNAMPMLEQLDEALTAVRDWASGLVERWAGNGWGTSALDEAVSGAPEAAQAVGSTEALMEVLTAVRAAIEQARGLGEMAAEQGAYGGTAAFTPN